MSSRNTNICPSCGTSKYMSHPDEYSGLMGCMYLFLGGWLLFLIYAISNAVPSGDRLKCLNCGLIFQYPSPPNPRADRLKSGMLLLVSFLSIFGSMFFAAFYFFDYFA